VTERRHEVALTPEEVDAILGQAGNTLLVGGQALAFWANYYQVEPVGQLSTKITSDADFIGTAVDARRLGKATGWKVWLATLDDVGSGQTAKVTKLLPGGGVKQVDFLSGIVGLDSARIQARAVEVKLPAGVALRVLHPLDVLESRLRNLQALMDKRNAIGVAQAQLAIEVVGRFIAALLDDADQRTALDAAERVIKIALDKGLVAVAVDYGIDPLLAIPSARFNSREFQTRRWPQAQHLVVEARRKYARRKAKAALQRTSV
jgi:hypothetical protein